MTLTEVSHNLLITLLFGLGLTLWIYLLGLSYMFLSFVWDFYMEYKLREKEKIQYIETLIKKGMQKEQEELLEQVKKKLEMEFFHQTISEDDFKKAVAKRKEGDEDVDLDR